MAATVGCCEGGSSAAVVVAIAAVRFGKQDVGDASEVEQAAHSGGGIDDGECRVGALPGAEQGALTGQGAVVDQQIAVMQYCVTYTWRL